MHRRFKVKDFASSLRRQHFAQRPEYSAFGWRVMLANDALEKSKSKEAN